MSAPSNSDEEKNKSKGDPHTISQDFQVANLTARVPDAVSRGVFANGVLVLQAGAEFVLDFILRMNLPHRVAARVVLPVNFAPQFIEVLKANLEGYRKNFGHAPPALPIPNPPPKPPTIEEIYQDLKIVDEVLAGAYANTVMVTHTAGEFCLEFIANFYPKAVVTARVFLSAPQAPVLLQSMTQSWQNLQAKLQKQQQQPPSTGLTNM
jgi:hypothetical protein